MTTLYNDEYRVFQGPYWATQDKERLPGTTSERRALASGGHAPKEGANQFGGSSFAGGASVIDKYGVAGLEWVEFGGGASIKKSWFMFDKEIVALGADLRTVAGNPYNIDTTIENRVMSWQYPAYMSNGTVESAQTLLPDGGAIVSGTHADTKWIHAGNGVGYYFPTATTVKYERENRKGGYDSLNTFANATQYSQSYLTMFIDHGVGPNISGSAYEYVILPGFSKNETAAYSQNPEIAVLVNNAEAQAVSKPSNGLFAANFWNDGGTVVSGYVYCDKKASVITKTDGQRFFIGVSDPTHLNDGKTTVTFAGKNASVVKKDERITVINGYPLTIEVDMRGSDGGSISAEFSVE
jgi:hyaluronate lyase